MVGFLLFRAKLVDFLIRAMLVDFLIRTELVRRRPEF
jgi:hypothetical protein